MRWLCFPLLASPLLTGRLRPPKTSGQPRPKSLQFDIAQVPATRDSFVFRLRGEERRWAVWQYEIRPLETTQEVVYSATSEFRPVEEERLRIVVDRLTASPSPTFHHIDLFSPPQRYRDGGARPGGEAGRDSPVAVAWGPGAAA